MGSLLSFLVVQAYLLLIKRQVIAEGSADRPASDHLSDLPMTRAIIAGAVVLPAAGGLLRRTVVMRERTPLWGLALWLVVRFVASFVLAADASRLKKRRQAEEEAAASPPVDET